MENVDGKGNKWAQHVVYSGDEHHDGAVVVDLDHDGDNDIALPSAGDTIKFYSTKTARLTARSNTPSPFPEGEGATNYTM